MQCEIDACVIEACRKYIPSMAKGFDHPKVELHIGDGLEFMKNHTNEFDIIITDSSDPVGNFKFQKIKRKLKSLQLQENLICFLKVLP